MGIDYYRLGLTGTRNPITPVLDAGTEFRAQRLEKVIVIAGQGIAPYELCIILPFMG